ncbi:MAG: hypothetical protein WCR56_03425 [Bacilli bacterium]|jgi:hypothetical protein
MKTNYDEYLKRCGTITDERKRISYSILVSVLSALLMLTKLLNRKEKGKKPFSSEFDFESSMSSLKKTISVIEDSLTKREFLNPEIILGLKEASRINLAASKEIKMASLKEDFDWIGSIIQATTAALDTK